MLRTVPQTATLNRAAVAGVMSSKSEIPEIPEIPLEIGIAGFISYGILILLLSGCVLFFWLGFRRMVKFWVTDPLAKDMRLGQYVSSFVAGNIFKSKKKDDYFAARNFFSWSFFSFFLSLFYLVAIEQPLYKYLVSYFGKLFSNS